MKKILSIALCLLSVLSLAACGGSDGGKLPAEVVGTYNLYEMSSDGETFDNEFLKSWEMEDMFILELKEDGTGTMTSDDESENFTWDDKKIKGKGLGDECEYTYQDGKLTMTIDSDTLVFQKKDS